MITKVSTGHEMDIEEVREANAKYAELLKQLAEFKAELAKVDLPTYPPYNPSVKPVPNPEWLQTHPEHTYELMMFESNDENVEQIAMDREDYIWLKRRLAERWGVDKAEIKRWLGEDEHETREDEPAAEFED